MHRRYLPWLGSTHHRDSSIIYGSLLNDVGVYRGHVGGETFLAFKYINKYPELKFAQNKRNDLEGLCAF